MKQGWLVAVVVAVLVTGCNDDGIAGAAGDVSDREQPAAGTQAAGDAQREEGPAARTEIVPGLTMRVLEEGGGTTVAAGDTAVVHYTGWLHDPSAADRHGAKFDSSRDRGQPFDFTVGAGEVIRGWDEGVRGMQVGEIRELTIAPELGYGARGVGPIPPNSTLVFEVELLDVVPGNAGAQ